MMLNYTAPACGPTPELLCVTMAINMCGVCSSMPASLLPASLLRHTLLCVS